MKTQTGSNQLGSVPGTALISAVLFLRIKLAGTGNEAVWFFVLHLYLRCHDQTFSAWKNSSFCFTAANLCVEWECAKGMADGYESLVSPNVSIAVYPLRFRAHNDLFEGTYKNIALLFLHSYLFNQTISKNYVVPGVLK